MTDRGPEPKRVRLSKAQLETMSKDEIVENWVSQETYIDVLEAKTIEEQRENSELVNLRESEEKMKQQQAEATRRENVLVMRLTTKEQEMQEYANQIQELKQAQIPGTTQLRSTLIDPAVNLMFERMRKELELTKAKLEETQNDLSAWKFTPDSNTGKRLMAKCRLLHQENEELGKMISSGRVAKLEGDLALQRNFSEEMKKSQAELDEFLLELDEDVEGMQSTICYLQQQLRESKEAIQKLQFENQELRTTAAPSVETSSSMTPETAAAMESSAPCPSPSGGGACPSVVDAAKNPSPSVPDEMMDVCMHAAADSRTPNESPRPSSSSSVANRDLECATPPPSAAAAAAPPLPAQRSSPRTNGGYDGLERPESRTNVTMEMEEEEEEPMNLTVAHSSMVAAINESSSSSSISESSSSSSSMEQQRHRESREAMTPPRAAATTPPLPASSTEAVAVPVVDENGIADSCTNDRGVHDDDDDDDLMADLVIDDQQEEEEDESRSSSSSTIDVVVHSPHTPSDSPPFSCLGGGGGGDEEEQKETRRATTRFKKDSVDSASSDPVDLKLMDENDHDLDEELRTEEAAPQIKRTNCPNGVVDGLTASSRSDGIEGDA